MQHPMCESSKAVDRSIRPSQEVGAVFILA